MRTLATNIVVAAIYLSGLVSLAAFGLGLKLLLDFLPLWAWALVCASHVVSALGIALLIDNRQKP